MGEESGRKMGQGVEEESGRKVWVESGRGVGVEEGQWVGLRKIVGGSEFGVVRGELRVEELEEARERG